MEIRTLESESSLVIAIKGLLDTSHSQDLEKFIESKIGIGYRKYLFDFTQLESLSSGGIGFFLRLIEKSKSSSPRVYFAFTGMNSEVQRLFRFFGLEKRLNCFNSLDSAKEYLSKISPPELRSDNVEPNEELTTNSNLIRNDSLSNTQKYKPVRDRIQFYYKGSVPPTFAFQKKLTTSSEKDRIKTESEPVSKLEAVDSVELDKHFTTKQSNAKANPDPNTMPTENISTRSTTYPEDSRAILTRLESKMDDLKEHFFNSKPNLKSTFPQRVVRKVIIHCESCGVKLKVHSKGHYKCPSCRTKFYFNGFKSVSNLEKLT